MSHAPDEKLVRRAQAGDKDAFAELFTQYEGPIFGYLYRMVGNRAWAEDLAQEAFIRAHQRLGQLGPPYDFKSWVYRIASNMALDGLRRYRHTVPLPDWDAGEATAPEPAEQRREADPQAQARLSEVRAGVWRAIHELPANYRQILILREIDGLAYREIAQVLDISLDNVRVTLHRARNKFRDLYGLQVMVEEGREACQELDDLLSAYVDGELDRATRRRVEAHIDACPECQKKQQDLLGISSLLGVLAPVFPPPSLHQRFLTRLRHLPPPETPSAGGGGRGGGRSPKSGAPTGKPGPWVLLTLAGGAAVLFALVVVAAALLILPRLGIFSGPADTPTPPVAPATPSPTATQAPTATSSPPPSPTPTDTSPPPTATRTLPPPTHTSTPTPAPRIDLWVDAATVPAGNCTTIHWETEHVQAVFFDGQGVAGTGARQACPCVDESHTLEVILPDGSRVVRQVTIQVTGTCVTPTPSPTPDQQGPPAPAPSSPTGGASLTCLTTPTTLSWSPVSDPAGVAGYTVRLEQRLPDQPWEPVGQWKVTQGTELDVDTACGISYRWAVRAQDGLGNPGPWSAWAAFSIREGVY